MNALILLCILPLALGASPVWHSGGKCGVSKYKDAANMELPAPSIVGGIEARAHEFPWQVSLKYKSNGRQFCGGSIINEDFIMTAAHCTYNRDPATFYITVGEHSLKGTCPEEKNHDIQTVYVHDKYRPRLSSYDISLLKLTNKIQFSDEVAPVCAPETTKSFTESKAAVSGWGNTYVGGGAPDTLRYTTVRIITNEQCQIEYSSYKITDDMMCASDNRNSAERDSCQGDSGGPMVVEDNGVFSQIGVVSWGIGCASGYPGVYARVNFFEDWIQKTLAK